MQDGSANTVAQTTFTYDQGTPTATSGTPQHLAISGGRGNLTTVSSLVQGLTTLNQTFTYYDTGTLKTATDVNLQITTYNYPDATSTCGNAFPTSVTLPITGLSTSQTWNCTGAVVTQTTDANNQVASSSYTDSSFWRPASTTDPANATTNFAYPASPNFNTIELSLTFNVGNSIVDSLTTVDGLGRPHVQQKKQGPGPSATYDSAETDYDSFGRPSRVTMPYSGTAGQTNSSGPATTTTYDPLGRPSTVTDGGTGTLNYTYTQNDVLVAVGPAPTGENSKQRQMEYDALGRLISVCEITSAAGSGTCAQTNSKTGYWTKYTYDAAGRLLTVTQNAQATSGQQTRTFTYDLAGRLLSEANPESGTTSYVYDTDSTCGTSSGDLVKRTDAVGDVTCYAYDALHRVTSITYPSGTYASNTSNKYFVYDAATVNGQPMANPKGRLAEAYTAATQSGTKFTDVGLSYTPRGEVADVYQSTSHSGGYYHVTASYWAHGAMNQLSSNITALPSITYGGTIGSTVGLDGEGRITQVTASSGQNPVTSTAYNLYSSPPNVQVTLGSGDSDLFSYDANTGRMTQYKFTVGATPQSVVGNLTWNANGSLATLAITDPFNSANAQTCTYLYDDLSRIGLPPGSTGKSVDCGATKWQTVYSYDAFGNITKTVPTGGTGDSFQPTYTSTSQPAATNRILTLPGSNPTYDANGNVAGDGAHSYSWDAEGRAISIDGVGATYDALGRMVEQNRLGTYMQIVYAPTRGKLALMNGQTLSKAFLPLPGGGTAVYNSAGLQYYRHADWLGSSRFASTPTTRAMYSDTAYAPFGETYAPGGTADPSFTGQNQDTVGNLYDFMFREYSTQGRWPSPDPAGLAAVDPSNPQTWNRYAYVGNQPLNSVDPLGLFCGPGSIAVPGGCGPATGVDAGVVDASTWEAICRNGSVILDGADITPWVCGIKFITFYGAGVRGDSRGGGGNTSGGFWQRVKTVNQCAAKNAASLATVFNANENNFWVSTFLGNDASTISNAALGPNRSGAAASLAISNPTKYSLINLGAKGVGQIPTGGQVYAASGTLLTPYGEAINMTPVNKTVAGAAGDVVGAAAEAATIVKAFFDVGAYLYAEVQCAKK